MKEIIKCMKIYILPIFTILLNWRVIQNENQRVQALHVRFIVCDNYLNPTESVRRVNNMGKCFYSKLTLWKIALLAFDYFPSRDIILKDVFATDWRCVHEVYMF